MSVQADSEERMENEMLASKFDIDDKSEVNMGGVGSPSGKSIGIQSGIQRSNTSFIQISQKSPKKKADGKIKNVKDTLFNPLKSKADSSA